MTPLTVAIGVLAAILSIVPVVAHAQSAPTVIYACVNNSSGTIHIVTAAATCNTNETKLQWNVTGPPGPQGPKGDRGSAGPTNVFGLVVSSTGSGSGAVTSADGGIHCGADCTEVYPVDTSVTLNATPAADSTFGGWSGDCSGTGPCTLTLNATRTAIAQFDPCTPLEHHNGLGEVYLDCAPLGTYDVAHALKAATAWGNAVGGVTFIGVLSVLCTVLNNVDTTQAAVVAIGAQQAASWGFAFNAGHVHLNTTSIVPSCPLLTDPVWD